MYNWLLNKYKLDKRGIIHIGCHKAEEIQEYIDIGIKKLIYIEANPKIIDDLKLKLNKFNDKIQVKLYQYIPAQN